MQKPTIPGPDPDTRTPKFRLPDLACDAHTHIFGPADKYPYAPDRPYTPPDEPLEAFRALHAKLGIGRAVIVNASVHGTDNRVALDAIAVSNGTFRAVANLDGSITERGLEELHEGGFRGCRFNLSAIRRTPRYGRVPPAGGDGCAAWLAYILHHATRGIRHAGKLPVRMPSITWAGQGVDGSTSFRP